MANPLTLLRSFDYYGTRRVLVVQTGTIASTLGLVRVLRRHFPEATIDGVVRDADAAEVGPDDFARVTAVRFEDRIAIVRQLRAEHYDVVALLLGGQGSRAFRLLPYLVRTKNILLFNEHFDYFPLKWTRVRALAHHLTGHDSSLSLVRWAFGRLVLLPLATIYLVASTLRFQLRAARRRRSRPRRATS